MSATAMSTAEAYLRSTITGDEAVAAAIGDRVYRHKAPKATAYPCVVLSRMHGRHQKAVGGARLATRLVYKVVVINRVPEAQSDQADVLAGAIDALLEDTAAPGEGVVYCECVEPYDAEYEIAGVSYIERGGLYRIVVD